MIIRMAHREVALLVLLSDAGVSRDPYRKADVLLNRVIKPLENGNYKRGARRIGRFSARVADVSHNGRAGQRRYAGIAANRLCRR